MTTFIAGFGEYFLILSKMRYKLTIIFMVVLVALCSCAPQKAYIDRSVSGMILWPGPPEPPRIKYKWSVSMIATTVEGKRGLYDFLVGDVEGDVSDPRTSNVLMRPFGVFADQKEKLYIADAGAYRVTVIDLKTSDVFNITSAKDEEFLAPVGVVADSAGRIYVSDAVLSKVFVFGESGKYLFNFEGAFKRPTGMAIDSRTSRIYVSDTLENTVYIYSLDGKRLGNIGQMGSTEGNLNLPTHLFVDKHGLLYVMDAMNFRVQIFNSEGLYIGAIGSLGDAYHNLDKPKGVAVDSEGNIYVVDSIKDTVKIFDKEGNLLLFFGNSGFDYGDFWLPSGIFIDDKDMIYVADTYNMRIQAFQFVGKVK